MRETLFSPTHWTEALYVPPFGGSLMLRAAPALERVGARLALPGAGVLVVEATKQLYRPVGLRRLARRMAPSMQPVLVPQPAVGALRNGPTPRPLEPRSALPISFGPG